ncbi:Protein broad-minded [Portunus trituberculatus]|uniref:Protein broad-minded n=1 Tax=Portunus trituberculatus TaxID=210409 RepID=A0A5B7G102_PORTR|nr:Protein broad-minded [Portunus trituberculatus]
METKASEDKTIGSKQQVKDLLTHMDPMIYLAGTADNTSEMLMYLADMDPSFHKLHLVKSLRMGMRESLTITIEEHVSHYLQEQKGKMYAENPVDFLVDKILGDSRYADFVRDSKLSLENSIHNISENFDDEIVTGMFGNDDDDPTYSVSPNESNESSLNSSLNQSGLMFLHPAQYDNIAESLTGKREYESRNDSLNILISVSPGEPVMQDGWPDIRKGLRDCLFEECDEIFDKSLKVHCRLLTSQVHNAVKEAYLNLLDAVAGFYFSKQHVAKIPGVSRLEEGQAKEEDSELKVFCSYIRAVLLLLDAITSTHLGQRYILLGRKRKPSSKSGLSGISSNLASEVLDLILLLMKSKCAGSDLKRLCISICSSLLASPIGIHVCIDHPFMEGFLGHLKERSRAGSHARISQGDGCRTCEPLVLSVPQSLPLLTTLLVSFRGVFLLEGEGVLPLALSRVMPERVRKGGLTSRILAHICSSQQGCSLLGSLNIVRPLWDILSQVVRGEEQAQGRPLLQDEREEAMGEAVAPLLTLLATFQVYLYAIWSNHIFKLSARCNFKLCAREFRR